MKKIISSEEMLKKDEYGLYINASNYEDQRARMIHGIEQDKEMLRLEKQRNNYLYILLIAVIAIFIILLISCNPVVSNTIYKKQKLSNTYTVYYFGDKKFFSDSTLYEPGDSTRHGKRNRITKT